MQDIPVGPPRERSAYGIAIAGAALLAADWCTSSAAGAALLDLIPSSAPTYCSGCSADQRAAISAPR